MVDAIELHEKISELTLIIDERESSPEPPYWFYDYVDDVPDDYAEMILCLDCIYKGMPSAEIGEHYGGGYCMESDTCQHCGKCGELLEYSLTDYGVESELEHFLEYPPNPTDDADVFYHLARIAHGLFTDDQKRQFLTICKHLRQPASEGDGI